MVRGLNVSLKAVLLTVLGLATAASWPILAEDAVLASADHRSRLQPLLGSLAPHPIDPSLPPEGFPASSAFSLSADPFPAVAFDLVSNGVFSAESDGFVPCPPNASFENEPDCGFTTQGLVNGGCDPFSAFENFTSISCGETVCSTYALNNSSSFDQDWYSIFVSEPETELTIRVTGSRATVIAFAAGTDGQIGCSAWDGQLEPVASADAFEEATMSVCVGVGTYYFFVQPDASQSPFPCGASYTVSVDAISPGAFDQCPACPIGACCVDSVCTGGVTSRACDQLGGVFLGAGSACAAGVCGTPVNNQCSGALPITCGETVLADLFTATLDPNEDVPSCTLPSTLPNDGFVGSVWYTFQGTGGDVFFSTCGTEALDSNAFDSLIVVYEESDCGAVVQTNPDELGCNDTGFCGNFNELSQLCVPTEAGRTYLLSVQVFSEQRRGLYELSMSCDGCPSDPIGACCEAQNTIGTCVDGKTELECELLQPGGVDGRYLGDGTTCADDGAFCPTGLNTNDSFNSAEPLDIGVPAFGNLAFASGNLNASCSIPVETPGLYYTVVGNGNVLAASTIFSGTPVSFDTQLHVYCDPRGSFPQCVSANDDFESGTESRSLTRWCSEPGREYTILVSGGSTDEFGPFELQVLDTGLPCDNPPPCVNTLNCSLPCAGRIPETEPVCGTDFVDVFNGGCVADPADPPVRDIEIGQAICGESGTFAVGGGQIGRDQDWMRFELEERSIVTFEVDASFMHFVELRPAECVLSPDEIIVQDGGTICQTTTVTAELDPGVYDFVIRPQAFNNALCDLSSYTIETSKIVVVATGACCVSRCDCQVTTPGECEDAGGVFQGIDTTCEEAECNPCPTDLDGSQFTDQIDFVEFLVAFGVTDGGDADCNGVTDGLDFVEFLAGFGLPCPGVVPEGACCTSQCGCGVVSQADCAGADGTFLGVNTTCEGEPCRTCPGDFNNDGNRDGLDFPVFLAAFAATDGGDFDCDGDTDDADFIGFLTVFGVSCAP